MDVFAIHHLAALGCHTQVSSQFAAPRYSPALAAIPVPKENGVLQWHRSCTAGYGFARGLSSLITDILPSTSTKNKVFDFRNVLNKHNKMASAQSS